MFDEEISTLCSNKAFDAEISSSNHAATQLYKNNLKCVEWQGPDDGHLRPKHVVFDLEYNI